MSHEIPRENYSEPPKFVGMEWLDEWRAEQKLTPHDAHEMLRETFRQRLDSWRETHPEEDSWVIPFHYTHEDGDPYSPIGALWVPNDDVQDVINKVGEYIHMSALIDMSGSLENTGIDFSPISSKCSRMHLDGEVPEVYVPHGFLVASMLCEQVERDFGVVIKS